MFLREAENGLDLHHKRDPYIDSPVGVVHQVRHYCLRCFFELLEVLPDWSDALCNLLDKSVKIVDDSFFHLCLAVEHLVNLDDQVISKFVEWFAERLDIPDSSTVQGFFLYLIPLQLNLRVSLFHPKNALSEVG